MQQKNYNIQDALQKSMNIEAMVGYPNDIIEIYTSNNPIIIGLQHQIVDLIQRFKDMNTSKFIRP